MSITLGTSNLYSEYQVSNHTNNKLENTLNSDVANSSDEELLEACQSFETYFVEQVFKAMEKTVMSTDDNEYTEMFGDMLTKEYADGISKRSELGIAQMLYESMKRV